MQTLSYQAGFFTGLWILAGQNGLKGDASLSMPEGTAYSMEEYQAGMRDALAFASNGAGKEGEHGRPDA